MARKSIDFTVTDEGRDKDKTYVLTEMPAREAAHWAVRLFTALVNAGFQVPDDMMRGGMAAVAQTGFDSIRKLNPIDTTALLDDLMLCVKIRRDPGKANMAAALVDGDIEEVTTYFTLAAEVFKLHTGFSFGAAQSTSISAPTTAD